ncbi:response regulator transcription factor [Aquabacterium sp. A08]|uniref:response regulator n=1 Tax=Aquabacterium sp. A08 TaxID=2718532 RepID=UPI00142413C5|nr:response regulator transcription factor [Aquabacterium sp. A08]NIC41940.1 response regulator transcription factor [Aquabacterium sp. A08]NIC41983.1 response regulator transcription factor [Aquabacterium sp. A08]
MIKVVLCDDHAVVRRGVRDTLMEATDVQVVGEADGYASLRDALRQHKPDVLLLDVDLPGRSGLEILAVLQEEQNPVRVVMVSMYPEDQYAIRCLKAGAMGYLNKGGDPAALLAAVRTVAQGRKYITAEIAELLANHLNAPEGAELHDSLSERELQTLKKIASGKKLSQIAEELMISPKTVSVYRARVLEKLGLSNNAELTVYAIRNQLV